MTAPDLWRPVGVWLAVEARGLPPLLRLALYDVAMAGGSLRCGSTPELAVDELVPGAGEHLARALDRGLVAVVDGRLVLVPPDASERPAAPAAVPARPASSDHTARLKRLTSSFSDRGLTTEAGRLAWLATPEGQARVAQLGLTDEEARERAATAGRPAGRFGASQSVQPTADAVVGTAVGSPVGTVGFPVGTAVGSSPPAPPSEEKTEKEEVEKERAAVGVPVGDGGRLSPDAPVGAPVGSSPPVAPATSGATPTHSTPRRSTRRRHEQQPLDVPPAEGTEARRVFDIITRDRYLSAIVVRPGEYAEQVCHPDAHPGVDVPRTVLSAAEYLSRDPSRYTDGRRYLSAQLRDRPIRRAPQPPARPAPPPPSADPTYGLPPPEARLSREEIARALGRKPTPTRESAQEPADDSSAPV